MKNYSKYILILVLMLVLPSSVFAAVLSVQSSSDTISVGDTLVFKIVLNTEGKTINAIDGEISVGAKNADFTLADVNTTASAFTLWPKTPSSSADGKTVSFIGGVPGGVNTGDALIFNIVIQAKQPGEIIISPGKIQLYLNDGKGTAITPVFEPFSIKVIPATATTAPGNEQNNLPQNAGSTKLLVFAGIIIILAVILLFYKIRRKKQDDIQK